MIKAIIFDLDGTLIDTVDLHVLSFQLAFRESGVELPASDVLSYLGKPTEFIVKAFFEKYSIKGDIEKVSELKRKHYLELVKGKNVFLPDAEKVVGVLRKKFKLALFTGSDRKQILFLHKFLDNFQLIVAGKECVKPKPAPDTLWFIAKKLKVSLKECVYVGDALVDMEAGKSAEMFSIAIENPRFSSKQLLEAGANKVIKSLDELLLLRELND